MNQRLPTSPSGDVEVLSANNNAINEPVRENLGIYHVGER